MPVLPSYRNQSTDLLCKSNDVFFMRVTLVLNGLITFLFLFLQFVFQKQPSRGVLRKARRSGISIKLLCKFIEIALRHWCFPVNLLHIYRTPFPKNTSGRLLLVYIHFFLILDYTVDITLSKVINWFLLRIF